jgi:hypothetical protein
VLFDPAHHEPLRAESWDEERVRDAIRRIVTETEAAFDETSWWPIHPRDEDGTAFDFYCVHGLYIGAAGVLWALHRIARTDSVQLARDYSPTAARLEEDYLRLAGVEARAVPGLWAGEAGILLVADQLAPDPVRTSRLEAVIRENATNETRELMWGSPGTLLAGAEMYARTSDDRWRQSWADGAEWLWDEWRFDDALECFLWTQELYGQVAAYLGPAHGLAGNVLALAQLSDGSRLAELAQRATRTLERLAFREDGLANWPPLAGGPLEVPGQGIRTQWCHGAPGIVASLARLPSEPALDELLLAGGELTWAAGPHAKGPGLCHGTAGNGYAFLALHERTGDPLWLERARAFALHALAQVESERARHGRGRFSLWTGDLGVAVFALQCIDGSPGFPTIDAW